MCMQEAGGRPFLTNIRNICAQSYLYSPLRDDGSRCVEGEAQLCHLEALTSRVWPGLTAATIDLGDAHIRRCLSLFVATMYLRHPRALSLVKDIQRMIVSRTEYALRQQGVPAPGGILRIHARAVHWDLEQWEQYRNTSANDIRRMFVRNLLATARYFAERLLAKRWSLLVAGDPVFITSDAPVTIHHPSRQRVGIATTGAVVVIPAGPRCVLMMDDQREQPANQVYHLRDGSVGAFTLSQARQAHRFMISHTNTDIALAEMLRWNDSRATQS